MAGHSESKPLALVTGLAGFTGVYLKEALERHNFQVIGLDHTVAVDNKKDIISCDLLDQNELKKVFDSISPHVVLHLAGIASVTHENVSDIYKVNIVGTRNLLHAISEMPVKPKNIIIASTANVYGNTDGHGLDEATPLAPTNDYAVSKLAMEYMARIFSGNLPLTIIRPFNYTGRGQTTKFVIPKIIEHFRRREPVIELGNIDVTRDFSDVRRVAESYSRLAGLPGTGEVFNICSGKGVSLQEIVSILQNLTGHSIEVRVNPAFVRTNEVLTLVGSCLKLETTVGSLPDYSIKETLTWMLDNKA